MRILNAIYVSLLLTTTGLAQKNLVVNPGLEPEETLAPGTKFGRGIKGSTIVRGWTQATDGTVDFYNSELSTVNGGLPVHKSRTGSGRIGMVLDMNITNLAKYNYGYKEYAQTQLSQPLEKDSLYSLSFYVVLDKRCNWASRTIGACFSLNGVGQQGYAPIEMIPDVETNAPSIIGNSSGWSLVQGFYKARGGEQFLTIGSLGMNRPVAITELDPKKSYFSSGLNPFSYVAYYYFDDVGVYKVSHPETFNVSDHISPATAELPYNNLVLVVDVSSSMMKNDKIKTVKQTLDSLLNTINSNEIISILTFDASPKILVKGAKASRRQEIIAKIDSLRTGGGTNVNAAIQKAYELLDSNYIPGGNNKVVLITDAGYQLSRHSREVISDHSSKKDIGFSTLIFNDINYRKIKKICRKNKGKCENIDKESAYDALDLQFEDRPQDDYTKQDRNKRAIQIATKVSTGLLLIGIVILKLWK